MPARVCRGKNFCSLAGDKGHVGGFVEGENTGQQTQGMGVFGKIRCMAGLPTKAALTKILKARMKAIEAGPSGKAKAPKPPPGVPTDLAKAPETSKPAAATFRALSPCSQRDYVTEITDAKQGPARDRRIEQAFEGRAEGKPRNYKYIKNQRLAPPDPVNPGVLVKALLSLFLA